MKLRAILPVTWAMATIGCLDPTLLDTAASESSAVPAVARFVAVDPPQTDRAGVRPSSRFRFELPAQTAPEALRLFRGGLSEYHQQRVAKAELPNTLLEREVPVTTWPDLATGATVDAGGLGSVSSQAQSPLEPGERYTWAVVGQGPVLSFEVGEAQAMDWHRVWPTANTGFWGYAAYCHEPEQGLDIPAQDWVFEPGARRSTPQRGLGLGDIAESECVHFDIADDPVPELLIPPVSVGGAMLDPAPLQAKAGEPIMPVTCERGGQPLGAGCAHVQDDRISIDAPASPALWLMRSGAVRFHSVVEGPFVVRGLIPGQTQELDFVAFSADGQRYRGQARVTTEPSRPHVVINELLANPLGAEPGQEWVELYNDGSSVVDLGGWVLTDGTGDSVLPAQTLAPGEYLVVISEQYSIGGSDVPIAEGAAVLRVASLAANGFSNSGEELRLISAAGQLQSRFAARSASVGGVSVARTTPQASDDAGASFAPHGEPGASPGAANTF